MKTNQTSAQLGAEKIPRLIMKLSVPAFIGMFVMALYNVVDTIFIARGVGTIGVAGLSIAFPIQIIISAFAMAVGIGGASIVSIKLGAKRKDEANEVFGHLVWLVVVLSIATIVISLLFLEPLLRLFGATEAILPYASDYLSVILIGSLFLSFAMSTNNVVRAEGNAKMAMWTMVVSAGINLVLDPIFIFGLNMGIQGAAIATVIAQACSALWIYAYFKSGRSTLTLKWIGLIPNIQVLKEIISIGTSTFVRQVSSSLMFVVVNWMLIMYGSEMHVAIFGIINRILMFALMPIFGVVQGIQPIVGYNYGAQLYERVGNTIKLGFMIATLMSTIAWLTVLLFPQFLIHIFSTDQKVIEEGASALRTILVIAPTIGFQMVSGGIYQALGKARKAFILSIARQLLFLIPIVLLLPMIFDLPGVWAAFPIADGLAFLLSLMIIWKDRERLFSRKDSIPATGTI
ncbi:MATE family efflux transporter [Melghirimyces algeriensis]|uniref:Multidrug export protein MepA n=1 Tax=Melghirimyces algeriensis TaxID=910412 RepID=A0A521DMS2_9BACL|nr:MATE family efflux transporter [Melghirimyces algeriensis]SMO73003.1 putative efflux protein, MATE family [Melghirimyces algeriensis]